jgi:L-alanine-DL-glutamate epimerase-like enolase superfamily enzyme
MATDLKSHAQGVSLTRFWGGDPRGVCVQVTTKKHEPEGAEFFDSVQLTRAQAAALAADLMDFAQSREVEDFGK